MLETNVKKLNHNISVRMECVLLNKEKQKLWNLNCNKLSPWQKVYMQQAANNKIKPKKGQVLF